MLEHITRSRGLASLALFGVVASGCSAAAPASAPLIASTSIASSSPPMVSAPPSAAAAVTPALTSTPSRTVGPSADPTARPIPDGIYMTGQITKPLALAALKAAGVPVNAETKASIDAIGYPNSWRMQLIDGHYTRWCVHPGSLEDCDRGTYAFPDAHTMVIQDPGGGCITTLAMRWQEPELHLRLLKTTCGPDGLVVFAFSFGSTPWTREP